MKRFRTFLIAALFFPLLCVWHFWTASPARAVDLPTYTIATLPAAGTAGRLAYVTDESDSPYNARGVYLDNGSQWFKIENNVINARIFPGVTGRCSDNQTTGLTNWINTVKKAQAQSLNFAGQFVRRLLSLYDATAGSFITWNYGNRRGSKVRIIQRVFGCGA